jgi:hypothetical protein
LRTSRLQRAFDSDLQRRAPRAEVDAARFAVASDAAGAFAVSPASADIAAHDYAYVEARFMPTAARKYTAVFSAEAEGGIAGAPSSACIVLAVFSPVTSGLTAGICSSRAMTVCPSFDMKKEMGGLRKFMPEADGPLLGLRTCLYDHTPDDVPIIDTHPEHANVTICGPLCGAGFKFVPAYAEAAADLAATGTTKLPIDFLRIGRLLASRGRK